MDYSMLDIVNSLIDIEKKAIQIYEAISINSSISQKLLNISSVLITEEKRHIEYYEEMKLRLKLDDEFLIPIEIYNKISNHFFEFTKLIKGVNAKTIPELLDYALALENINAGLLKQVLGAFVGKNLDSQRKNYDIISELIQQEEKHIHNLKIFIKTE